MLSENTELVVTDKFPKTLLAYKAVLDRSGKKLDILYIADAGVAPPLRKNCIDIAVDFFATNEHNFYHDDFWPDYMWPYLKENAVAAGVYFYFENGECSMQNLHKSYPESSRNNFSKQFFQKGIQQNYHLRDLFDCGFSIDSGSNLGLGFHKKGEKMHLLAYEANRQTQLS